MVRVRIKGRLQLEGGPVMVPFLFLNEGQDKRPMYVNAPAFVLPPRFKTCDTSVASATHMSHVVPENCRERGI